MRVREWLLDRLNWLQTVANLTGHFGIALMVGVVLMFAFILLFLLGF